LPPEFCWAGWASTSLSFNTHLGRQFEFIQHTWVNSPKFDGGYAEDDPITGNRGGELGMPGGMFTIQFREAFLILAGVVSLLLSGPGPLAVAGFRASTTAEAAGRRRGRASPA
jgi:hypothetical protein